MTDAPRNEHPNDSGAPDGTAAPSAGSRRAGPPPPAAAPAPPGRPQDRVRLTAWVRGRVQGVGFRWSTRARALEIGGLSGYVSNLDDGRVQVVAEGMREACEALLAWLDSPDTPGRADGVTEMWGPERGGYEGFSSR